MRKFLFTTFLLITGFCLKAQNVHLFVTGGLMNYQGDLQAQRITFNQAHPFAGLGMYYEVTDKLYIRAGLVAGKVSADDKLSPLNKDRNLNFTSQILEFHVGAEYDIFNAYEYRLTPYIFAAVAGYHFNPYTYTVSNQQVYLQPLGTEGQGFGSRKKYSLTQLAVPVGGGLKMYLTDNIGIRVEAAIRVLLTDYLDDVSTVFVNRADLLANNGQLAVDLAFRRDELNPSLQYPNQGARRGNPNSKDYYYTAGVTLSFRLSGDGNRGGGKTKVGCPVNVY